MRQYGETAALLVLLLLALAAAGCGSGQLSGSSTAANTNGYQVTDTQGSVLKLPRKPQRIIPINIAIDEIVLGMVQPERVAAVSYLADDPGISTIADKAGRVPVKMRDSNAEMILSLQPDLVIVPDWSRGDLIQTLRELGLPVFVCKGPASVLEVKQAIREISQAIGEEEAGADILSRMDGELADIADDVARIPPERRKSVVLISQMNDYGGKGTLFDDICGYAGVINGAAAAGLGKNDGLTKECIVKANPDLILLPTWRNGTVDVDKLKNDVQHDPALQSVKAVRTQQLAQLPDAYLYCASQDIVRAIRDIYNAAYPESERSAAHGRGEE
ncbi:MAG: ABC transporter substrate-binding protein [Veillonellales bacterium]